MPEIKIYEPALCCSTGVCGPEVDEALVRLTADQEALTRRGASIERFNLASHPAAFVASAAVRGALQRHGLDSLPLVVVDGEVVSRGGYPTREQLEAWSGLAAAAAG